MELFLQKRLLILSAVFLLLVSIFVARWIAGWGLVTVHVHDVPLGKVIASIARQGHVRIESSLDANKLVSLDVTRVPVIEAIDTLAIRADTAWRLVYLAAPSKSELIAAVMNLRGTGKLEEWTTYFYPGPPLAESEALDPRYLELKMEGSDRELSKLLNQAAQKSGVMTAFPKEWAPSFSSLPKANQVRQVIPSLVKSAQGVTAEFFFLSDRERRGGGPFASSGEAPPGDAPPPSENDRGAMNPDWIEQRQLAQIAKLPPEQQEAAKKEVQELKALFASMKGLTPEQRRAQMQQMMSNPDLQEKMADRMLLRDLKRTAQQRITRAIKYIDHKAAIKSGNATTPPAR